MIVNILLKFKPIQRNQKLNIVEKKKMGLVSFVQEIESPIAASRLFKALVLDYHNLFKQLIPESIISNETIQGDGGIGSIKQINFIQGLQQKKFQLSPN